MCVLRWDYVLTLCRAYGALVFWGRLPSAYAAGLSCAAPSCGGQAYGAGWWPKLESSRVRVSMAWTGRIAQKSRWFGHGGRSGAALKAAALRLNLTTCRAPGQRSRVAAKTKSKGGRRIAQLRRYNCKMTPRCGACLLLFCAPDGG